MGTRRRRPILLYGASGYTGGLIARVARALELPVVLAGRDHRRLSALGPPFRVAALDDPAALRAALKDVAVVINAAGPFATTARPLVEACIAAGVHYLDISGEVDAIEALSAYDAPARRAGVMVLPGAGFDVVPSDCLALRVTRRLPGARRLRIAITGLELVSRGSARTITDQIGSGVRVRRGGEVVTVPEGTLERSFDFGGGARPCTAVSWGDVATAFRTTGVPDVEVYFEATAGVRAFQMMGRTVALFPPVAPLSRLWMNAWTELQPPGPSESARGAGQAIIQVEAEAGGRRAVSRVRVPEAYTFTAACAPALASRVARGELEPGFQTPAAVFGADLLQSFEGVRIEDVS
jgi:short subunit dehydrogenase-like uncharacterized protein